MTRNDLINKSDVKKLLPAFSLLELSMVIVIISTLLSLVIIGSTMKLRAHANTIIVEQYKYQDQIYMFYKTYGFLPGDFSNADKVFGCNGDLNVCSDGDGDGIMSPQEGVAAWSHISLARIASNYYSGSYVALISSTQWKERSLIIPISNVYDKNITSPGYTLRYSDKRISQNVNSIAYNVLYLSLFENMPAYTVNIFSELKLMPALSPKLLYIVDQKIDDGKPKSGNIVALRDMNGGTFSALCHNAQNDQDFATESIYSNSNADECIMASLLVGVPQISEASLAKIRPR